MLIYISWKNTVTYKKGSFMSRPGITYQDIANAADVLKTQGTNPTIEAIRKITGTGSNGTIGPHLRRWKEIQSDSHRIAFKDHLPEQLVLLMKELWGQVIIQSETKVSAIEETHQKTMEELQQELDKYKANNQRWQNLFNQWQQEKSRLINDKLSLESAISELQKNISASENKQDTLSQRVTEKQERILELHRLHSQVQANLEHYRESAREQRLMEQHRYEQQEQQLQQTIKQLQQRIMSLDQDNSNLKQQYEKITFEKNSIQLEHEKTNDQLNILEANYSRLESELNENIHAKDHWQLQYRTVEQKLNEQIDSLINLRAQIASSTQQQMSLEKQLQELIDQNKILGLDKWDLAQEKAQLEGQNKQLQLMLKKQVMASG